MSAAPLPGPRFPRDHRDLTPEILTAALSVHHPGLVVRNLTIVEAIHAATGRASTADRVILDLEYEPGPAAQALPRRVILKTMLVAPHAPAVMYETECRFYREIRPLLAIEAPTFFAASFDPDSGQFGLVLEDLTARGASFPDATAEISLDEVRSLIEHLATIHARFWGSPALERDLAWMATPSRGGMEEIFAQVLPIIEGLLESEPWRRDIFETIGRPIADLHADMVHVAATALENGPRTLLHGDTHIGNSYRLGEGRMGWLDFQLAHRGCYSRDLTYIITTALPIESRRRYERELIDFYLGEIRRRGVSTPPSREEAWLLHRRSTLWGLVIGWLICPTANYGYEITAENLRRLAQAIIDLEAIDAAGR